MNNENHINIYNNSFIRTTVYDISNTILKNLSRQKKTIKHFVFDLDETLGCFTHLDILWTGLQLHFSDPFQHLDILQEIFNEILDLYPEFLRYGIVQILTFLYNKQQQGLCGNVYIYTNNQCSPNWVNLIIKYIECKGNIQGLFHNIVRAFKPIMNGNVIERMYNIHTKTKDDFIKCTLLPKSAEICFIDDSFYPKMCRNNIFYIQLKPFYHSLTAKDIYLRFAQSKIAQMIMTDNIEQFEQWFLSNALRFNYFIKTHEDHKIDILVSKKLMSYIRDFFYMEIYKRKTCKIKHSPILNKTIKTPM